MDTATVEVSHVCKAYPGVRALDDVSLRFEPGSVHALLGANGAGKSTLIKIMSGHTAPTSGRVLVDGRDVGRLNPERALRLGIAAIYQDAVLAPDLSVAENVYLGNLPTRLGVVDRPRLVRDAQGLLAQLGVTVDARATVSELSAAQRQFVAVAHAVARDVRLLVLDEPTAALAQAESELVFALVRRLKERGCAVVYITHRLDEVFGVCDVVSVLRDGRLVKTCSVGETSRDELVRLIAGRELRPSAVVAPQARGGEVLHAEHLSGGEVRDASLSVRAGEVVGVYGLAGSGTEALGRLLYGADRPSGGKVFLEGKELPRRGPAASARQGLGYVPADRAAHGLLTGRGVDENLSASSLRELSRLGVMDRKREATVQDAVIDQLTIKTASRYSEVGTLSGGNQQKVVLGKWLAHASKALILDEPTQGVDVGARQDIYRSIGELTRQGMGMLVISSDADELAGIANRVLVMRDGEVVASFEGRDQLSAARLVGAASGALCAEEA